jgi:hypothetical protein
LQLLREGLIWRVGDGSKINIWRDQWLPKEEDLKPVTRQGNILLSRVSELIDPSTGTWDAQLISQTFCDEDAAVILAIPLVDDAEDFLAWHLDSRGIFTVKLAYKLHVKLLMKHRCSPESSDNSNRDWKQNVWKKI